METVLYRQWECECLNKASESVPNSNSLSLSLSLSLSMCELIETKDSANVAEVCLVR